MAGLRRALIVWTCTVLLGCTNLATQSSLWAAGAPARKIVVFGDSLTEGGLDEGKSYTNYLQQKITAKGYPYEVVNQGISGDTTTGGVNRVRAATSLKPEIVILELGGNDGLRGIPVASTKKNLESMIQTFQKAGIKVLLAGMSLPPNYGPDYIKSFEGMYKDLAAKYKTPLIPFLLSDLAAKLRTNRGLLRPDGIHPTTEGNRIVADTVMRYLEPMLKK
jgi:acyl-CoA thioesterase I